MPDYRSGHPQIYLRKLRPDVKKEIVKAAKLRDCTVSEYVSRLVELHRVCRGLADEGDDVLRSQLKALGLDTVREE